MTEQDLKYAIKETKVYADYEQFKKNICTTHNNVKKLYDLYLKAKKFGIEYLKDKNYILISEVKLLEEILYNENNKSV